MSQKTMREQNEIRERVLRVLRRMPCGHGYTAAGFAHYTGCYDKRACAAALETHVAMGLAVRLPSARGPAFYVPVRAECKPGKRCNRLACRLAREAARLSKRIEEVVAS